MAIGYNSCNDTIVENMVSVEQPHNMIGALHKCRTDEIKLLLFGGSPSYGDGGGYGNPSGPTGPSSWR
ncbi:uncharacterized protein BO72DRAFT_502183 [Aspergillus fijiensis CBS 313.89]|uniref:Uncharacterized protein n=1 Tax=Aspergillus fijiensis CBS 313.89 TaxID=1448319 RepID=A0A8G1RD86_9EURO|nr:uncharacterized protein BO72DRAFT_502183 [Aspergillus fijiensis CBS 313.89]RAK71150.1 hypothetical protein BO72DRAFT_502183 [Aspergillus fijiensis CBS 313.89]